MDPTHAEKFTTTEKECSVVDTQSRKVSDKIGTSENKNK